MIRKDPKVTVFMALYEGEKYVYDAIQSILRQSFTDFELLIINDGSTDRSECIVKGIRDDRIKYYSNQVNKGLPYTRNRGIELAKGDYIAVLDSDDIALPNRLEKQVDFMNKNPDYGLIGSWYQKINKNGNDIDSFWKPMEPPEKIKAIMLFHNYFAQPSVMMKKSMIPQEGYREIFQISQDYDLWVRIAEKHMVWNIPEILLKYRVHKSSITKRKSGLREKLIKEIYKYQFEKMGLGYTAEDIDLHFSIDSRPRKLNETRIMQIEKWFDKIIEANGKTNYFDHDSLIEALRDKRRHILTNASRRRLPDLVHRIGSLLSGGE